MILRSSIVGFAPSTLMVLAFPLLVRSRSFGFRGERRIIPFPVIKSALDNGLKVVVVPMDSPGLMAHYLAVRAGSRNEVEPGLSGFAHFFEHMMFRGTERYSMERYNEVLKRLGADGNAFTTDDWTCYHITAASSTLASVMEIEADRFMNLKYTVEVFQKEAGAVLGEYNKSYSAPLMSLFEKLRDVAYDVHTYKHTTMGFLKDIEDMPNQYEYSSQFFHRWYRPDNCALVVAGDLDPARVIQQAEEFYGAWEPGVAELVTPREPPQNAERRAHLTWKNPTLPYLLLGYHVPAFAPEDLEGRALDVLSLAAFSATSPLHKDLVLDKQWVESLWGGVEHHRDPNLFLVMARVKDPTKMDAVGHAIDRALEALGERPLPPERVEAVKSHIRYGFLQALATPDQVARSVSNFLQLTGETSSIDKTYETFEGVSALDVRQAASRYFTSANRTVITLSHEIGKE